MGQMGCARGKVNGLIMEGKEQARLGQGGLHGGRKRKKRSEEWAGWVFGTRGF
jgi:hypothetical protein